MGDDEKQRAYVSERCKVQEGGREIHIPRTRNQQAEQDQDKG